MREIVIAAFILVLSVAALLRFGVAQWKSIWQTIAEQPLSGSLQSTTGVAADAIGPNDFELFARLCNESARPAGEHDIWLKEVRVYYRFLRALRTVTSGTPALRRWTEGELAICSRYAGVILDRRLNTSLAYATVGSHR